MGPHSDYKCVECNATHDLVIKEAKTCPDCSGPLTRLYSANINTAPSFKKVEKLIEPQMLQKAAIEDSRKALLAQQKETQAIVAEAVAMAPRRTHSTPTSNAPGGAALGVVGGEARMAARGLASAVFGSFDRGLGSRKVLHQKI